MRGYFTLAGDTDPALRGLILVGQVGPMSQGKLDTSDCGGPRWMCAMEGTYQHGIGVMAHTGHFYKSICSRHSHENSA